jgi:hypothetical protein
MFSSVSTRRLKSEGGGDDKKEALSSFALMPSGEPGDENDAPAVAASDTDRRGVPASRLQYLSTLSSEWMWDSEVKYSLVRTCLCGECTPTFPAYRWFKRVVETSISSSSFSAAASSSSTPANAP